MALMTGDDGKVLIGGNPLADITAWEFETAAAGVSYASSATGGFRQHIAGARHGRGRFDFRIDDAAPAWESLDEGSPATLHLHLDDNRYYAVPVIIESIHVGVTLSGGQPISGTATFITTGAWTGPS